MLKEQQGGQCDWTGAGGGMVQRWAQRGIRRPDHAGFRPWKDFQFDSE